VVKKRTGERGGGGGLMRSKSPQGHWRSTSLGGHWEIESSDADRGKRRRNNPNRSVFSEKKKNKRTALGSSRDVRWAKDSPLAVRRDPREKKDAEREVTDFGDS